MRQGKGIGIGLCYGVEQDTLFSKMSLDTPREAHVFEMSNDFCNTHTPRLVTFQAALKELLGKLRGMLWGIFEERQELQFALIVMLTNLSCAPGKIGKRFAVSW